MGNGIKRRKWNCRIKIHRRERESSSGRLFPVGYTNKKTCTLSFRNTYMFFLKRQDIFSKSVRSPKKSRSSFPLLLQEQGTRCDFFYRFIRFYSIRKIAEKPVTLKTSRIAAFNPHNRNEPFFALIFFCNIRNSRKPELLT